MTSPTTDAEVVMDRLESASSVADAISSLQSILTGLQTDWQPAWLWHHEELPDHLVHILQHAQLKTTQTSVDDECVALVLKIYQYLSTDRQCLLLPAPSRYLEALLDVMDRLSASTYTRVLALQRLEQVSKFSEAKDQWLQAPNGIHRLADALTQALDNPLEEPVRTQALQVALVLAQSSPIAKVFLFAEVETKLLDATWQVYGGLTKGNPMVVDVLIFIKTLLQQADSSLHELVWQRPSVGPRLAQLLDLRGGHEFLHPEEYVAKKQQQTPKPDKANKDKEKPKLGPLSARKRNDDQDDLDTLLQTKTSKTVDSEDSKESPLSSYPQLLAAEETVISHVLDIVDILLEKDDLRRVVWTTYAPGVCLFIWEMALMTPPPPGTTAFFALPSCRLQQKSLELVASKLCDTALMDRIHGLDRLLEVVCTGGGLAQSLPERLGCSQAALAVLRNVLDANRIHEILLHTLAPPPMTDDDNNNDAPPPPTVVQKLWNTVAENLQDGKGDHKILFLSGALGGLSVFLAADVESREMLLQSTPPLASMDHMLEVLVEAASKDLSSHERIVIWSIYRFLAEYIYETPRLVQTLLCSPGSTQLATLATTKSHTQPMVYLILGLCMEFFPPNASEGGGWTPTSLLDLLQSIGISRVTKELEAFKVAMKQDNIVLTACALEAKYWQSWYETAVWTVRKRIVRELAGSSLDDDDSDSVAENSDETPKVKPLQRLIAQQTTELEDLRSQLQQATSKIASQEHQLETWQRRMKSNPTELDGMLNELTAKTAALEEQITTLHNTAKQSEERHEQQVASVTKQLEEQREEATKLRTLEQEAQEERDRMSQELEALSQAYSSLEEEYRRSSSTVPGTPQGPTSSEVSTLRAENARMRQDAKAADDWMAMAVQRMNEMGAHNGQLQQELTSLKDQLASTSSQQVQTLQQEIDQLTKEGNNFRQKVTELEQLINQEQQEANSLREQLDKTESQRVASEAEWRLTQQRLEEEKQEQVRLLEQSFRAKVTELEREKNQEQQEAKLLLEQLEKTESQRVASEAEWRLTEQRLEEEKQDLVRLLEQATVVATSSAATATATAMTNIQNNDSGAEQSSLIKEMQSKLEEKSAEILSLQTALEQARTRQSSDKSSTEPPSSSDDVLKHLESDRKEVEEIRHRSQEEIYKKESIIRELEGRLSSGLGPYKLEDIRERDEEIEELRAANEAAQEWMAKAVEHHNLLQEKVATLTNEKAALLTQQQQQAQLSPHHVNEAAMKLLESEVSKRTSELYELQQQLAAREAELVDLRAEFEASQSTQEDMGIAREDFQVLQKQLEEARSKTAELESKLAESSELATRLDEFQSWADLAQSKIADLIAAKERSDHLLSEAKENCKAKDAEIEKLQHEVESAKTVVKSSIPSEIDADRSVIDQLHSEVEQWKAANLELSEERNSLKNDYAKLQDEFNKLQAWTDSAQQRILDVVTSNEHLEVVVGNLRAQLAATCVERSLSESRANEQSKNAEDFFTGEGDRIEDSKSSSDEMTERLEGEKLQPLSQSLSREEETVREWAERVAELETAILALKSQAQSQEEAANATIALWQQSHSDAESRIAELQEEVAILREKASSCPDIHPKDSGHVMNTSSSAQPIDAADFFGGVNHEDQEETPSVAELLDKLNRKEAELQEAKEALERDEEVVREWEGRVAELEAEIDLLQTRAQEQEEEANAAISLWQEAHAEAEKRCSELETELADQNQSSENMPIDEDGEFPVESEPQMKATEQSEEIQRLKDELLAANEALEVDQDVVRQWEDRVAQLEATIKSLTNQIEEEQMEANEVISRWQESFNDADNKCALLEQQLANLNGATVVSASRDEEISDLHTKLDEREREIAELKKQSPAQMASHNTIAVAPSDVSNLLGLQDEEVHDVKPQVDEQNSLNVSASVMQQEAKSAQYWEQMVSELQQEISVMRDRIEQQEKLNIKSEDLRVANENLSETERLMRKWKGRAEELEVEMRTLVVRLKELQGESDEIITNLQSKCDVLEERCNQLQVNNDSSWKEKLSAEKHVEELKLKASLLNERIVELEGRLEATAEELSFTKSQLTYVTEDKHVLEKKTLFLQEKVVELEASSTKETLDDVVQAKEAELSLLKQTLSQDEAVVKQWEERVRELEYDLRELQEQLVQQESEANSAIEQWQETYSELEEKCSILQGKLTIAEEDVGKNAQKLADRDWTIEQLQAEVEGYQNRLNLADTASEERERLDEELAVERGRHKEAREEVEVLTSSLEAIRVEFSDFRTESENVVTQWTERVEELEGRISELETQLALQEAEANDAIASWEAKSQELENELELAAEELNKTKALLEANRNDAKTLEQRVGALTEDLENKKALIESINSEREHHTENLRLMESQLAIIEKKYTDISASESATRSDLENKINELASVKAERDRLKEIQASKSQDTLEEERDRLTVVIAQLEEELNVANNMVQAFITDGSSDRATEAAAHALRFELDELKMQVEEYRLAMEEELYKREAAEHEIERLRDDIAALVYLNEHENLSDEIQQRTAKAVERLKMKERIEIDQLRKSLYRSIEETEAARASEKQANEQLSKLRLQTAVGEQEIIAAKSEIIFLTQALEELRMNEENKRASLEYRISSLEDETDVLRKYHSSELETVRNELAQLSMEKDRILHQLKESERTNSALVFAVSKAESAETEDVGDLEAEVAKLRIEIAHLLTVAADDKARAERRLREALAAHRATAEADTILEHELRLVAESNVQSLKAQLDEYRNADRKDGSSRDDSHRASTQAHMERLANELEELRHELQKVQKENAALRTRMEQAALKSKTELAALTEECRLAQSKVHKFEREGRYDAAVKSEMAKLRLSPEKRGPYSTFGNEDEDPALERVNPPLVGVEAFDLIRKQKEEIQEERKMYLEFLAEHDDLLALLAQHDLERECLKEALSQTAGMDAVEEVLRKVEQKALEQFGNVIKVL